MLPVAAFPCSVAGSAMPLMDRKPDALSLRLDFRQGRMSNLGSHKIWVSKRQRICVFETSARLFPFTPPHPSVTTNVWPPAKQSPRHEGRNNVADMGEGPPRNVG